jgi:hypothetical protein
MTARDHNKLLSIFYFIQAGLQLLGGVVVFIVYVVLGGVMMSGSGRQQDQVMGGIFFGLGFIVGLIMLALGGFTLFTAFKVLNERPVARTLGIILSILVLFSFPLGTALGIYGLWFFFGDVGKEFYASLSGGRVTPPPPAPNSWQ